MTPKAAEMQPWSVGYKLEGGMDGVSGIQEWEFPCQRAHLTASLMENGDVPQGPDGIQWSAR